MRNRNALFISAALVCGFAHGQAVRSSTESFPVPPASFNLPVAPAAIQPKPVPLPIPEEPARYLLKTGEPIHKELQAWATREGWELFWQPAVGWRTLRATEITRQDVASAVTEVIDILRAEGKPVRLVISEGNKVMEVITTEIRND